MQFKPIGNDCWMVRRGKKVKKIIINKAQMLHCIARVNYHLASGFRSCSHLLLPSPDILGQNHNHNFKNSNRVWLKTWRLQILISFSINILKCVIQILAPCDINVLANHLWLPNFSSPPLLLVRHLTDNWSCLLEMLVLTNIAYCQFQSLTESPWGEKRDTQYVLKLSERSHCWLLASELRRLYGCAFEMTQRQCSCPWAHMCWKVILGNARRSLKFCRDTCWWIVYNI